jgi:hypothetical protein
MLAVSARGRRSYPQGKASTSAGVDAPTLNRLFGNHFRPTAGAQPVLGQVFALGPENDRHDGSHDHERQTQVAAIRFVYSFSVVSGVRTDCIHRL